jgi:hypothetical protein
LLSKELAKESYPQLARPRTEVLEGSALNPVAQKYDNKVRLQLRPVNAAENAMHSCKPTEAFARQHCFSSSRTDMALGVIPKLEQIINYVHTHPTRMHYDSGGCMLVLVPLETRKRNAHGTMSGSTGHRHRLVFIMLYKYINEAPIVPVASTHIPNRGGIVTHHQLGLSTLAPSPRGNTDQWVTLN